MLEEFPNVQHRIIRCISSRTNLNEGEIGLNMVAPAQSEGPPWSVMYSSELMKAYLWTRNVVVTLPRLHGPHSTRPSQVLLAYMGHGWTRSAAEDT